MILHSVGPAHPHSSTTCYGGGQIIRQYTYDLNGNMTQRIEGSNTYTFAYDQENRLVSGAKNSVTLASYTYDGDGRRVKAAEGSLTTVYIGDYYEWRNDTTTTQVKYYYAGGQRIAMRTNGVLSWLLGDHLGSTAITANGDGSLAIEQKYTAWGQTRSGSLPTDRQYTGQINELQLGLYFYNARFYDSYLARFIQADTYIPDSQEVQAWDRYVYVNNNPVNLIDPSGHYACGDGIYDQRCSRNEPEFIAPVIPSATYYDSGVKENENAATKLGHTIYYEGGGLSANMATNIMQTLHNRAYNAWNCAKYKCGNSIWEKINPGEIPWEEISNEQYKNLILYLASDEYTGSAGGKHPAYNGWETDREVAAFEHNPILANSFSYSVRTSASWLHTLPGTDPRKAPITYNGVSPSGPVRNPSVMYFYANSTDMTKVIPNVYWDYANGQYQYYNTSAIP